jgi:NADPH2:quinone reductase
MDRPVPGPGEVRVRIAWSGVNPSDVKSRAGTRSKTLPFARIVPHSDGSGVIDAVGDGVSKERIGQRVWIWNGAWNRAEGTAAEWIALPSAQAVVLPEGVPLDVGACLGIPALTACHAVAVDGGVAGKRVLVAGGAGAVGHYAVQMARLSGASCVIATVSSEEKAAHARAAGADVVIDYRREDVVARVMEATQDQGVDCIIEVDFAANAALDLALLAPEGRIVVYGSGASDMSVPFVPAIVKNARMSFFIVYNLSIDARARAMRELHVWLEAGSLQHTIALRLPLEQIAHAHEVVESGRVIGNVVLRVADGE